jgi:hypothetical protein
VLYDNLGIKMVVVEINLGARVVTCAKCVFEGEWVESILKGENTYGFKVETLWTVVFNYRSIRRGLETV